MATINIDGAQILKKPQIEPAKKGTASIDYGALAISLGGKAAVVKKVTQTEDLDTFSKSVQMLIKKAKADAAASPKDDIFAKLSQQNEFEAIFAGRAGKEQVEGGANILRVAAYIRVSSYNENQEDSYETQEKYFNSLLESNPNWTSAGVYSDYGISGTNKTKRMGFQRLLRHCEEGKIDRIITKSISRFSRNTADFLEAISILRDNNVTICFEKECLDTADKMSDLVLTTLGAFAQEESYSISENIRWGNDKRFPKGEVRNIAIYGYRFAKGENAYEIWDSGYRLKRVEIVEAEAEVVRYIFDQFIKGVTQIEIARELNRRHIPVPKGQAKNNSMYQSTKGKLNEEIEEGWKGATISRILKNERYAGMVLIQKTYTSDYLTHTTKRNDGQLPQHLIRNHHPAIIDEETFETAKGLFNSVKRSAQQFYPFSKRVICGRCGRFLGVRNTQLNRRWACPTASQNNGIVACNMESIYEEQLVRVFRKGVMERFNLVNGIIRDDVSVADLLSGIYELTDESLFTSVNKTFVGQMRARLINMQENDSVERDRAFINRELLAMQLERDRTLRRLRVAESKLEAINIHRELLNDVTKTEQDILKQEAEIESIKKKLEKVIGEIADKENDLAQMEVYWEELEADYEWRDKAIKWMETLPVGAEGTVEFLNGMTDEYVKAFALEIKMYDPLHYTIHWFDNTYTDVEMFSNIEDYRFTASYFDGYVMRENLRRRR